MAVIKKIEDYGFITTADSISVVIVGAGGTGGWFLESQLGIDGTFLNFCMMSGIPIMICDGDKVENKNIIRQNFIKEDVGEYKVNALVDNIINSRFYPDFQPYVDNRNSKDYHSLNLYTTSEMVNNIFELDNDILFLDDPNTVIVCITCVDNVDARIKINDDLWNSKNRFIHIDTGNNMGSGQIYNSMRISDIIKTKPLKEKYPEFLQKNVEVEEATSCADISREVEQILPINVMSGNVASNYLDKIMSSIMIDSHCNIYSKCVSKLEEMEIEIEFNLMPFFTKSDFLKIDKPSQTLINKIINVYDKMTEIYPTRNKKILGKEHDMFKTDYIPYTYSDKDYYVVNSHFKY